MSKSIQSLLIKEQLNGTNNRMRRIQLTASRISIGSSPEADIELKAFERDFLFEVFQDGSKIMLKPLSANSEIRLNGRVVTKDSELDAESILIFDKHQLQIEQTESNQKSISKKIDPLQLRFDKDEELIFHLLKTSSFEEVLISPQDKVKVKMKGQWSRSSWSFTKASFPKSFLKKASKEAPDEIQEWDIEMMDSKPLESELIYLRRSKVYDDRIQDQDFQSLASDYATKSPRILIRGQSDSNYVRIDKLLHSQLQSVDLLISNSSTPIGESSSMTKNTLTIKGLNEVPVYEFPHRLILEINDETTAEELRSVMSRSTSSLLILDPLRRTDLISPEDLPEFDAQIEIETMVLDGNQPADSTYELLMNKS